MAEEHQRDAGAPVDDVVTCFLRHGGEVLLVRRSGKVGTYRGRWGAISGFAEGDPLEGAWREISEETGLEDAVTLVKQGEPFTFEDTDEGHRWRVHPFLFDAASRDARLDWEAEEGVWVSPVEILARPTVPRLWSSYQRVAPRLEDLRADREHGSAWLSLRALECLRDRAAILAGGPSGDAARAREEDPREALAGLARALAAARPAMTALGNRVHRAMARAYGQARTATGGDGRAESRRAAPVGRGTGVAEAVRDAAEAVLRAAVVAEAEAAAMTAREAAGRRVLTLSRSGTVEDGLRSASPAPARVVVCESRPGGEGGALAARLGQEGLDVRLVPDAAVAWALRAEGVELLLVGADTVAEDGSVINKLGTFPAALAARSSGVRVLAAASSDKVAAAGEARTPDGEEAGADGVPLFERTPAELLDGVLTERGLLTPEQAAAVAAEHAADRGWDRQGP